MSRPWTVTGGVVTCLLVAHVAATWGSGWMLADAWRDAVGASAATLFSRPHAQFTAPFFHESLGHLVYNAVILLLALPVVVRTFGAARPLLVCYLASPIGGFLVDLVVLLPLAAAGLPYAVEAAPVKLVGASVVAFAAAGAALAAFARRHGRPLPFVALASVGIVAYELALAGLDVTRPFVLAYHLTGFGVGIAYGLAAPRLTGGGWRAARAESSVRPGPRRADERRA